MPVPDYTKASPPQPWADVGVVVIDNGHGGTHTGIVFVTGGGDHRFLHLAFHHDARLEAPPTAGLYGAVAVPSTLGNHLLMLLDLIEPANRSTIAYAFGFTGTTHFDLDNGRLFVGDDAIGLTCSTFVLAAFASVSFPLLTLNPWPPRQGDAETMAALIDILQRREDNKLIEPGYTARVTREAQTAARIRPEDVLAAATEPAAPPHAQATIDVRSAAIRAWVCSTTAGTLQ